MKISEKVGELKERQKQPSLALVKRERENPEQDIFEEYDIVHDPGQQYTRKWLSPWQGQD